MSDDKVQGEGDYKSAKRFNKRSRKFAQSEKGRASARKHDHSGKFDEEELTQAEEQAAEHAKDSDPASRGSAS
jgi:hypothetical protein